MDHDWKVELYEVPASVLLKQLQNIFDGIPMSKVEKKEACDLLREWIQDSSQSSGGEYSDSQMVLFKEFHSWFYDLTEMIHNSMIDRLLSHILLLTHHSGAASVDTGKLLNTVAPKHSSIIYTSSYPARPAPVVALSENTMYTENPVLGSPLISPHSYNPGGQDSIQDIKRHADGHDLYSTYGQRSPEGRLPDSIYPMNNLEGSPRNTTYPQVTHDVLKGNDL